MSELRVLAEDLLIVRAACDKWLAATDEIPDPAVPTDPEKLLLAAAWLDFYDETWQIVERAIGSERPLFGELPRDSLQTWLRERATEVSR